MFFLSIEALEYSILNRFWELYDNVLQDAANYRDELKEIAPHSFLKCSSDATTLVRECILCSSIYSNVCFHGVLLACIINCHGCLC